MALLFHLRTQHKCQVDELSRWLVCLFREILEDLQFERVEKPLVLSLFLCSFLLSIVCVTYIVSWILIWIIQAFQNNIFTLILQGILYTRHFMGILLWICWIRYTWSTCHKLEAYSKLKKKPKTKNKRKPSNWYCCQWGFLTAETS